MADNTANINVNVKATGSKELLKDSQQTAAGYKQVEESLKNAAKSTTRVPRPVAAAKQASVMEDREYNTGRGVAGVTGAASRDFANQAQGLGGLVRLYATFAANIFAATAAFTALSRAMDTTNMIKGLDQLGAASGRNLGYLSKQLALVSDGAISLRDSMEAVAKSSAAGMTNEQIMRMGAIAKNASLALGVAMPDAISRLSRGISKIEPELLDELGIFVRVDKAVRDYALSMGKAATSLSEFERRQAYALAVLKEGEQKFSAIDIDSNPYSKLLASLSNTAQQILEIINSIMSPIAKILATNTELITAAIIGLSALLVGKALPALGSWRNGLRTAAADAKKVSSELVESYGAAFVEKAQKQFRLPSLKLEESNIKRDAFDAGRAAGAALSTGIKEGLISKKLTADIGNNLTEALSPKQLSSLRGQLTRALNQGNTFRAEGLDSIIKSQERLLDLKQKELDIRTKIKSAEENVQGLSDAPVKRLTHEWQILRISRAAASKEFRLNTLAEVEALSQQEGAIRGIKAAFNTAFGSTSIGMIEKFRTAITGTFIAATVAVSTFIRAVQPWLLAIGLAIEVFAIIAPRIGNARKELEAFDTSIEALNSQLSVTENVFTRLSKIDPLKALSTEGALSAATAVASLTETIIDSFDRANKAINAMNWFDTAINNIKKIWGGDVQSVLEESLGSSLSAAFKALNAGGIQSSVAAEISTLLGYSGTDIKNITEAIEKFRKSGGDVEYLKEKIKELNKETTNTAGTFSALKETQNELSLATQNLNNSFLIKDDVTRYASAVSNAILAMGDAFKSPTTNTAGLLTAFQNLGSYLPDTAVTFSNMRKELENTAVSLNTARTNLKLYEDQIAKTEAQIQELRKTTNLPGSGGYIQTVAGKVPTVGTAQAGLPTANTGQQGLLVELSDQLKDAIAKKEFTLKFIANSEEKMQSFADIFNASIKDDLLRTADLFGGKVAAESAKVHAKYLSNLAQLIPNTELGLSLQLRSDQEMIEAQRAGIRVQLELMKSMKSLEITMKMIPLVEKFEELTDILENPRYELTDYEKNKYNNKRDNLKIEIDALSQELSLTKQIEKVDVNILKTRLAESKTTAETKALFDVLMTYQQQGLAMAQIANLNEDERNKLMVYGINLDKIRAENYRASVQHMQALFSIQTKHITAAAQYSNSLSEQSGLIALNAIHSEFEFEQTLKYLQLQDTKIALLKAQEELQKKLKDPSTSEKEKAKIQADLLKAQRDLDKQETDYNRGREIAYELKLFKEMEASTTIINNVFTERSRLLNNSYDIISTNLDIETKQLDRQKDITEEYKSANLLTARLGTLLEANNRRNQIAASYIKQTTDLQKNYSVQMLEQNRLLTIEEDKRKNLLNMAVSRAGDLADYETPDTLLDTGERAQYMGSVAETNKLKENIEKIRYIHNLYLADLEVAKAVELERLKIWEKGQEFVNAWKDLAEAIGIAAQNLESFGKTGSGLGNVLKTVAENEEKIAINTERQITAKAEIEKLDKKIQDIYDSGDVPGLSTLQKFDEERQKQQKIIAAAEKKNQVDKITGIQKEIGAVKGLFKEKSGAYRALSALEKTTAAISLALQAKQLATTLASIPAKIAEGVSTLFAQGGWAGFAGAAVFLALMASLGFSKGSGGGGGGPSIEDRQETQGTGYAWKDGEKVETGRGVFGDAEAKSNAIQDTLDLIAATSIKGMPLYNRMVELLESINTNIKNAAQNLYSIPGLRTGSAFGTSVGSSGSGNWLFGKKSTSTEILDSGIQLSGTLRQLADGVSDAYKIYETVLTTTTKSGFLGFGGGTRSSIDTNVRNLELDAEGNIDRQGQKALRSLSKIFSGVASNLSSFASTIGIGTDRVLDVINTFKLELPASLKDLKGDDLLKELTAVINSGLDDIFLEVFGESFIERFRSFGESASETVFRVLDTNAKVIQQFKNIGIDINKSLINTYNAVKSEIVNTITETVTETIATGWRDEANQTYDTITSTNVRNEIVTDWIVTGETIQMQSIAITEALVEAAGGMDKFAENANSYMENFYSEEELKNITKGQVTDELSRLAGIYPEVASAINNFSNSGKTATQAFRDLVSGLDPTNDNFVDLYTSLMNVQQPFAEVFGTIEDGADKLESLNIELLRLQGSYDEAVRRQRALDYKDYTPEEMAIQSQIDALKDQATWAQTAKEYYKLSGQATAVLNYERQEELKTLSELPGPTGKSARELKQLTYELQDFASYVKDAVSWLNASGYARMATLMQRAQNKSTMTDDERSRAELIERAQDSAAYYDMQTQLLKLQGNNIAAATREQEKTLNNLREFRFDELGNILEVIETDASRLQQQMFDQEKANRLRTMDAGYWRAIGEDWRAIKQEREDAINALTTQDERDRLIEIQAAEDLKAYRVKEIELLKTIGNTYQATQLERQQYLNTLSNETDGTRLSARAIQALIYAQEDLNKSFDLHTQTLEAEGKTYEALQRNRAKEIASLSTLDQEEARRRFVAEDLARWRSLENEYLDALGQSYKVTLRAREDELKGLNEQEVALKRLTYVMQDFRSAMDLASQIDSLRGFTGQVQEYDRAVQLAAVEGNVLNTTLLNMLFAEQDLAAERDLNIELTEAMGYSEDALNRTRQNELRTLTPLQRTLKNLVYAAQDYMKAQNLQIRLYKAQGKTLEATALERAMEIRANSSIADDLYEIYEAEDNAARGAADSTDDLKNSLESLVDALGSAIDNLLEYRKSLLLGDESIYTTYQKYQESKSQIFDQLAILQNPNSKAEDISAASSKLTELTDQYLGFSRKLFASSPFYTNDFNWVLSIIDSITPALQDRLTDAERQLGELQQTNETLSDIYWSTEQMRTAIQGFVDQMARDQPLPDEVPDSGTNSTLALINTLFSNTRLIPSETMQEAELSFAQIHGTPQDREILSRLHSIENTVSTEDDIAIPGLISSIGNTILRSFVLTNRPIQEGPLSALPTFMESLSTTLPSLPSVLTNLPSAITTAISTTLTDTGSTSLSGIMSSAISTSNNATFVPIMTGIDIQYKEVKAAMETMAGGVTDSNGTLLSEFRNAVIELKNIVTQVVKVEGAVSTNTVIHGEILADIAQAVGANTADNNITLGDINYLIGIRDAYTRGNNLR